MQADFLNSPFVPMLVIIVIFYFLLIKPQKEKQKELEEMKKNVRKNDQIVTTGGIHGTIVAVKEKTFMLRVDDNVRIEFDKEAIHSVIKSKE